MKKLTFILITTLFAATLQAQELPKASPLCKTEQVVGVTKISIEYSRPSVKDRTIFGDLVPYDKLWRLGANSCTKFTASSDVYFDAGILPAGTYALFATPSKTGEWKIDFNSNAEQSGTSDYDTNKNVISAQVRAQGNSFNESLIIEINNITSNSGVISIKWEKLRVDIPFKVETDKLAKININDAISKGENLDVVYYRAASYFHNSLNDDKSAMEYLNKSLAIKEGHGSLFLKGQILFAQGKTKEAIEAAEKAHKLAIEADAKGYADFIAKSIEEWKAKK